MEQVLVYKKNQTQVCCGRDRRLRYKKKLKRKK